MRTNEHSLPDWVCRTALLGNAFALGMNGLMSSGIIRGEHLPGGFAVLFALHCWLVGRLLPAASARPFAWPKVIQALSVLIVLVALVSQWTGVLAVTGHCAVLAAALSLVVVVTSCRPSPTDFRC